LQRTLDAAFATVVVLLAAQRSGNIVIGECTVKGGSHLLRCQPRRTQSAIIFCGS